MKNIVIFGIPRSGKSTLAHKLNKKFHYPLINGDCERVSMSNIFPELDIEHNKNFSKYLEILLRKYKREFKNSVPIILESVDITIKDINAYFNKEDNIFICLGVSSISAEEFADMIIKYDGDFDWTKKTAKEDLINYCSKYIETSKQNEIYCRNNNIMYIETSKQNEIYCRNNNIMYIETSENRDIIFNELIKQLKIDS